MEEIDLITSHEHDDVHVVDDDHDGSDNSSNFDEYLKNQKQQELIIPRMINMILIPIRRTLNILVTKLMSLQLVEIASAFLSFVSLILTNSSFLLRHPEKEQEQEQDDRSIMTVDDDHQYSPPPPAGPPGGFLKKMAAGILAAAYVFAVLLGLMVVAALLGIVLVRHWVDEPLYARETLLFDYSQPHPTAVFSFGTQPSPSVPVGHTLYASLLLLMPESDYNRDIGIFQVSAELISNRGDIMEKSSYPRMLRFRSWPIRMVRTFMMGLPLLLGITTETQTITFPILKHKEAMYPRTQVIQITLIPRAGTMELPQFYESEIVVESRLPWMKGLVYRWKWTFYVWTSMYVFTLLVMMVVLFLRPFIFPVFATLPSAKSEPSATVMMESTMSREPTISEEKEVSEALRRWHRSRNKRKAALLQAGTAPDPVGSSSGASSITMNREESLEEGSGDSDSVSFKGFEG